MSVMGSPMVSPEDVLESLMNDGTVDSIRLKIINQLKANEELKNYTISMVERSKVLNTPGAEKQTKRELFDALRQELETSVLEKASRAVWELILDDKNLGKEISDTVERVYKKLSGCEQTVLPTPAAILLRLRGEGAKRSMRRRKRLWIPRERRDLRWRLAGQGERAKESCLWM
ncbi:unnamed protein product [Spirodela intermedia]|uniref:Uncharacterized protein n=1 Tax=Spirodela intermedia TaxID=51605 RepID=A0A7I8I9F3_SPIIN|nr:unnamed protein product [Spirodela intermedia]CAA6654053.1 unnamed protein product [Spirodela intermedia]